MVLGNAFVRLPFDAGMTVEEERGRDFVLRGMLVRVQHEVSLMPP
jgi:hypothetical protein